MIQISGCTPIYPHKMWIDLATVRLVGLAVKLAFVITLKYVLHNILVSFQSKQTFELL